MKIRNPLLATVMAFALVTVVSAQQANTNDQQQNQGMQGMHSGQMQPGNMKQMRQNCQKTMHQMMQSNNRAKREIEAAKKSNDPAKMRSALDEAEQAIDRMDTHMKTCMNMMDMMGNMHGMMGGQQNGSQNPPKQ